MGARRTTHPQGYFTEPLFLSQPVESFPFARTYIKAPQAPENDIGNEAFWRAARHATQVTLSRRPISVAYWHQTDLSV